jgi:hypothetical protein
MTDAERVLYWQNYARKHEDTVKGFNGLTPQQVKDLVAKNEELEAKTQTADEKVLKQATKEAAEAAQREAEAKYLPQIQRSSVQGIASNVVSGDKLNAFLDLVSPPKPEGGFHPPTAVLGADGQVDETKVMGYLTAMYGDAPAPQGQRWQNAGQFAPPPPGAQPGSAGSAEAAKRFGTKPKS